MEQPEYQRRPEINIKHMQFISLWEKRLAHFHSVNSYTFLDYGGVMAYVETMIRAYIKSTDFARALSYPLRTVLDIEHLEENTATK